MGRTTDDSDMDCESPMLRPSLVALEKRNRAGNYGCLYKMKNRLPAMRMASQ